MRTDRYLFLSFALVFVLAIIASAQKVLPPKEVVLKWVIVYGQQLDLDRAADLTTINFRKGKAKKDWAADYTDALRQLEYEHWGGEVVYEKIEDDTAVIVLQAKIMTAVGGTFQKELYQLKWIDGKWLIDKLIVQEEGEFGKDETGKDDKI